MLTKISKEIQTFKIVLSSNNNISTLPGILNSKANSNLIDIQAAPIKKQSARKKMLYFSHGSMDLSQTFRLFM